MYSPTIRDAIAGIQWCKFTKNIYCLYEGEVIKLALSGSSLTSWINLEDQCKKDRIYLVDSHCITLGKAKHEKHGSVDYYAPVFEIGDITPEENAKANEVAAEVEDKIARNKAASGADSFDTGSRSRTGSQRDQRYPGIPSLRQCDLIRLPHWQKSGRPVYQRGQSRHQRSALRKAGKGCERTR